MTPYRTARYWAAGIGLVLVVLGLVVELALHGPDPTPGAPLMALLIVGVVLIGLGVGDEWVAEVRADRRRQNPPSLPTEV